MIRVIRNYGRAAVLVHKRLELLDWLLFAIVMTTGFLIGAVFSRWPS